MPFFFAQFHRQQHQRRLELLDRLLLEVGPVQEADDQPQLCETELGPIPPSLGHDPVQHAGQVQGLGEIQVLVQRDGLAAADRRLQRVVPDQDLVGADVLMSNDNGHRRVRQVDRLHGGAKVQQTVSPRDFEQPLLELAQHHVLFAAVVVLGDGPGPSGPGRSRKSTSWSR